jgi:hypothetical protein
MEHAAATDRRPTTIGSSETMCSMRHHPMRYFDRIRTEPSPWFLIPMAGGATAVLLYMVLTSITY